jgi:hypothetical protein
MKKETNMTLKLVSQRNHPRPLGARAINPELDLDPVQMGRSAQWALFGLTPEHSGVLDWYRSEWAALLGRKAVLKAHPRSRVTVHHTPEFRDRLALVRAGLNLLQYEVIDQNEELRDLYYGGDEEEAPEFQGDPGDEIGDDYSLVDAASSDRINELWRAIQTGPESLDQDADMTNVVRFPRSSNQGNDEDWSEF